MDIVIEAGGLRDDMASEYRNKAILLSTSRMRADPLKRGSTYGQATLTETDQLLPLLRRASAATALARDRDVFRRAQPKTVTFSRSGKLCLGASERKAAT